MSSIPSVEIVTNVFKSLLRRSVTVKELPSAAIPSNCSAGFYRVGDGTLAAACMADIALSAYAAAAFSLIPARVAADSVKMGVLEDGLDEIFAEVLNVASRLFTSHETHRITLEKSVYPPAAIPTELSERLVVPGSFFQVTIDGYGAGTLALFLMK